jgi:hypothetical protein
MSGNVLIDAQLYFVFILCQTRCFPVCLVVLTRRKGCAMMLRQAALLRDIVHRARLRSISRAQTMRRKLNGTIEYD